MSVRGLWCPCAHRKRGTIASSPKYEVQSDDRQMEFFEYLPWILSINLKQQLLAGWRGQFCLFLPP